MGDYFVRCHGVVYLIKEYDSNILYACCKMVTPGYETLVQGGGKEEAKLPLCDKHKPSHVAKILARKLGMLIFVLLLPPTKQK